MKTLTPRVLSLILMAAASTTAACAEKSPLAGGDTSNLPKDEQLFQQGLAAYDKVPPDYTTAQDRFDTLLADWPDSKRHDNAGYLAGRCRYELTNYADAITVLVAMRDAHPDSSFLSSAAYFTGRSRFRLGDPVSSVPDFEAAVAADPAATYSDNAAYWVGRANYEGGRLAEAIAGFEAFEASYPDSSYMDNGRYYHGRSAFDGGSYAAARVQFDEVLAIVAAGTPSIYGDDAQFYAGRSSYALGALADAIAAFQAVEADTPTSQYVDNALRYLVQAFVDQQDCAAAQLVLADLDARFPSSTQTTAAQSYAAGGGC